MTAEWASVMVAAIVAVTLMAGWMLREGRREGKLDAILERLTQMAEDHENRLRLLERIPRRRP